jgi:hypothetical protein
MDFMVIERLSAAAIPVSAAWSRRIIEMINLPGKSAVGQLPATALRIDEMRFAHDVHRWAGPADSLKRLVESERLSLPAGLIFHTGRCGSTLLANMLAVHPDLRVLNEPAIVSQLLLSKTADGHGVADDVRMLFRAFSRGLRPGGHVVVKTASWNVLDAQRILAALPGVPAVFLWRDAAEVVASRLHAASAWGEHEATRRRLEERLAPGVCERPMPPAEFYARAWRTMMQAGRELVLTSAGRVREVSYETLRERPGQLATEVAAWFGLSGMDAQADELARTARAYAKDPSAVFDPDGVHARPPLGARERELVALVTQSISTARTNRRKSRIPDQAGIA